MTGRNKKDDNVEDLINRVCTSFATKIEARIEKQLEKLDEKLLDMNNSLKSLNLIVAETKKSVESLEAKEDILAQFNKRNVLRFTGIKENDAEDVVDLVLNFINNELKISCKKHEIDSAFRVGNISSARETKPRTILVQFVSNLKRNEIYQAKKNLKKSEISVFEDLTKPRYDLLQASKKKYGNNKAWSAGGKIYIWDVRTGSKRCVASLKEL